MLFSDLSAVYGFSVPEPRLAVPQDTLDFVHEVQNMVKAVPHGRFGRNATASAPYLAIAYRGFNVWHSDSLRPVLPNPFLLFPSCTSAGVNADVWSLILSPGHAPEDAKSTSSAGTFVFTPRRHTKQQSLPVDPAHRPQETPSVPRTCYHRGSTLQITPGQHSEQQSLPVGTQGTESLESESRHAPKHTTRGRAQSSRDIPLAERAQCNVNVHLLAEELALPISPQDTESLELETTPPTASRKRVQSSGDDPSAKRVRHGIDDNRQHDSAHADVAVTRPGVSKITIPSVTPTDTVDAHRLITSVQDPEYLWCNHID